MPRRPSLSPRGWLARLRSALGRGRSLAPSVPTVRTGSGTALTRRGAWTLVVVCGGIALAWRYGARSINAVVLPALLALLAGYVQVRLRGAPDVERDLPPAGFPGEEGRVALSIETDSPFPGIVRDVLPPGVDGDPVVETTIGTAPVAYPVTYRARGHHEIGPAEVVGRDVLGLVSRRLPTEGTDRLVVYPPVRELTAGATTALVGAHDPGRSHERDEFDRLRGYDRGDPLRDVHWKSSAKRDDLIVKEFAARTDRRPVTVAAGVAERGDGASDPVDAGSGDRMAEAAASICVALLDAGVPVRLATPTGTVSAAGDREQVLRHLAAAAAGPRPDVDADVLVDATDAGATVIVGGVEWHFQGMARDPAAGRGAAAAGTEGGGGSDAVSAGDAESTGDGASDAEGLTADGGPADGSLDDEGPRDADDGPQSADDGPQSADDGPQSADDGARAPDGGGGAR